MNALEAKAIKGLVEGVVCLGVAGFIVELQILSLDLRIRKLEKNTVAQSNQAKEDVE